MTGRMTFPFNIAAVWAGHWQGSDRGNNKEYAHRVLLID